MNKFFAQFWARISTILAEVSRGFPQFPRKISRYYFAIGLENVFSCRPQFTIQSLNAQKTLDTYSSLNTLLINEMIKSITSK